MQSPASPVPARLSRSLPILCLASALAPAGVSGAQQEVLLIPNSLADTVWAVSPVDGAIISTNFIPNTEGHLEQPIHAIPSGTGTILVADEVRKSVFEYSANGAYLRTLAGPKQGVAGAYSLCVRDGFVYFTSGSGLSLEAGYIYKVALAGGPVTIFSDWTTVGVPRGIHPYGDGFMVGNSLDDDLEIVGANGAVSPVPFHDSDGVNGIDFPQQIKALEKGQIPVASWMVAGFTSPSGVFIYTSTGTPLGYYSVPTSPRGCHILENEKILFSAGTQLRAFDIASGNSEILFNGGSGDSFRFIESFVIPAACTGDVNGDGSVNASDLAAVLASWGTSSAAADVDGSGLVDGADLAAMLAAWGPC